MQSTALAGTNARMHRGIKKQRFLGIRLRTQLASAGWQSSGRMHTHRREPLCPGLGVFGSCGRHGFIRTALADTSHPTYRAGGHICTSQCSPSAVAAHLRAYRGHVHGSSIRLRVCLACAPDQCFRSRILDVGTSPVLRSPRWRDHPKVPRGMHEWMMLSGGGRCEGDGEG